MASTPPGGRGRGTNILMLMLLLVVIAITLGWAWLKNPPGTATPSSTGSPPTASANPPSR